MVNRSQEPWNMSYDDFTLSVLASSLGQTEDAEELRRRSQFYRNVIDRQTGYAQGRYADGSFLKENNAFQFCDFITEAIPVIILGMYLMMYMD